MATDLVTSPQNDLTYIVLGDSEDGGVGFGAGGVDPALLAVNTFVPPIWSAKRVFGIALLLMDAVCYALLLWLARRRRERIELEKVGDMLEGNNDSGSGTGECTSDPVDEEDEEGDSDLRRSGVPRSLSFKTKSSNGQSSSKEGVTPTSESKFVDVDDEEARSLSGRRALPHMQEPDEVRREKITTETAGATDLSLSSTGWTHFPPFRTARPDIVFGDSGDGDLAQDLEGVTVPKSRSAMFQPFPTQENQDEGAGAAARFAPRDEETIRSVHRDYSDPGEEDEDHDFCSAQPCVVRDDTAAREVGVSFSHGIDEEQQQYEGVEKLNISCCTESTLGMEESSISSTGIAEAQHLRKLQVLFTQGGGSNSNGSTPSEPPLVSGAIDRVDADNDNNSIDLDAVCAAAGELLDRSWSSDRRRSGVDVSSPRDRVDSFDLERFL